MKYSEDTITIHLYNTAVNYNP